MVLGWQSVATQETRPEEGVREIGFMFPELPPTA